MAADQLKPYQGESPEPADLDGEGGSEPAPPPELPVPHDTGAIPKKARGRPPRLCNEATAPVEPHPVRQGATSTPRRGRGRPRKHP